MNLKAFLISKSALIKQTRGIDSDEINPTNSAQNNSKPVTGYLNGVQTNSANNQNLPSGDSSSDNVTNNEIVETDSVLLMIPTPNVLTASKFTNVDSSLEIDQEIESTVSMEIGSSSEVESNTPYPTSSSPPPESNENSKSSPSRQAEIQKATNTAKLTTDAVLLKLQLYNQSKTLPWKPKVRLTDLEAFLDQERKKFLGYGDLTNDLDTVIGLPYPIHESVKILKQHLFISLAEEQIKLEEKSYKYPLSSKEAESKRSIENDESEQSNPVEALFKNLVNSLPQHLV